VLKRFLIIGGILCAVAVAVVAWGIVSFRREPIASLEKMSRLSLRLGGAEKHVLDTPGGRLVYWTRGEGPVVFLIHGANDQAGLWSKSVARVGGSHRFVMPDMPGHGESDPATGPIRFEMMLAALEALKAKESPDQPVAMVGNSLGGWIALLYALDHPGDVRQIVLENSGGISVDYQGPSLLPTTREEARAAVEATVARAAAVPEFILDDFVRRAPTSQIARMADEDFASRVVDDRLGEISVPTTLIWGEEDKVAPVEYAKRMQAMIPGAELRTIVRCGHVPHNECPDEFAKLLSEALDVPR
jgi:2-hydroxy-6-oxonona-2,4-dienedioate hydrolase